ncbi:hypothetical protein K402DRAFT_56250 [Aulographum hederae CBS 113979]|uniref:Uncharacterized protein n=1 Tax=Aulographum hederae CBS 113979 TaxID=1176131 RepID=A0A6G1H2I9_9PEZI|nr:hypothetical protein K402DRAFT_56250 [Aulographum hederae CBS 113979]
MSFGTSRTSKQIQLYWLRPGSWSPVCCMESIYSTTPRLVSGSPRSMRNEYLADMTTIQSILSTSEPGPVNDAFWADPVLQEQLRLKLGDEEFEKFEKNSVRLKRRTDKILRATERLDETWFWPAFEMLRLVVRWPTDTLTAKIYGVSSHELPLAFLKSPSLTLLAWS